MSLSRAEAWDFWRNPDADNQPEGYRDGAERTAFLLDIIETNISPNEPVLELGCNVGRNLNALKLAGYLDLTGVEINPKAVVLLRESYPSLRDTAVLPAPIEKAIWGFHDDAFGLVFTMAVLEHVHPDSEFVFAEMARVGRRIITIEDEHGVSNRHFPRDYGQIFTGLGMAQIEAVTCADVTGLGPDFMARVFV